MNLIMCVCTCKFFSTGIRMNVAPLNRMMLLPMILVLLTSRAKMKLS